MPPHSECHYSSALESWSHLKRGLFCANIPSASDAVDESTSAVTLEQIQPFPPVPHYPGGTKRFKSFPKSPRNVSFDTEVSVYEIPNVRDFSKAQLAEMYMTKEEMANIHAEAWEIIELMNLGIDYAEGNSFSKRGLVDLKDDNVERRRRMREQAYKVVFGMQSMHNAGHSNFDGLPVPYNNITGTLEKSGYSPQIMADLYMQVSTLSKNMAHKVAMYDAVAAGTVR